MRASGMPFVFHSETEGDRMLNSLATAEVPPKASMISRGESGDLFIATSIGAPIARRQAAPIGYAYRIATMTPLYIIATNDTGVHTASAGELPVVFNAPDTAQESNVVRLVRKS